MKQTLLFLYFLVLFSFSHSSESILSSLRAIPITELGAVKTLRFDSNFSIILEIELSKKSQESLFTLSEKTFQTDEEVFVIRKGTLIWGTESIGTMQKNQKPAAQDFHHA